MTKDEFINLYESSIPLKTYYNLVYQAKCYICSKKMIVGKIGGFSGEFLFHIKSTHGIDEEILNLTINQL